MVKSLDLFYSHCIADKALDQIIIPSIFPLDMIAVLLPTQAILLLFSYFSAELCWFEVPEWAFHTWM